MNQKRRLVFNDSDSNNSGMFIPESDLRTNVYRNQPHGGYCTTSHHNTGSRAGIPNWSLNGRGSLDPPGFAGSDCNNAFLTEVYDFSQPADSHRMLVDPALDSGFSHFGEDQDLAAALASYQPCDDCTPATKTTIPHHHHPSGRLAGASATLDGHFCCSWLTHDQPCFLCFQSAEALDHHIKNDHAGKDGTYRCLWQDCSKHDSSTQTAGLMNFGNKPKLMRHVHSHTGYKPFPCPYPGCDKGFVTKEQLKNHETTHTKSRKFKCDQCGKAFAVKSALTTHITAVHDEKKTHRCDVCGKAFADSSNLSKHKQTHYKDSGVKKQRSRRGTSSATSTRSSPSTPTTPMAQIPGFENFTAPPMSPGVMGPPALPNLLLPGAFDKVPVTLCGTSATSTTSSPPLSTFDPDCYCCEQRCPPPEGPPSPCNKADDCDRDGFCDLPDCYVQNDFQLPQWDEMLDQDPQRSFSQMELEEQFTNMHGS
ncbi:zinc-finger protein [Vermiconidia calcicola]|uniref:Zinc-finger protein n=1 Tax=Vermiconidia calcicola TaxID=1690605 RepID=A0ACC3NP06_9PEZI|nr:zinc-finger protein [Vermiconidia calcicola]